MKKQIRLALAGALLLGGASAASAATMSKSASVAPRDTLSLSSAQQKTAWNDISKQALKQNPPSGFTARVGEALPSGVNAQPIPSTAENAVPALKAYHYAMLQKRLLIVNPSDKKIVEVITQ